MIRCMPLGFITKKISLESDVDAGVVLDRIRALARDLQDGRSYGDQLHDRGSFRSVVRENHFVIEEVIGFRMGATMKGHVLSTGAGSRVVAKIQAGFYVALSLIVGVAMLAAITMSQIRTVIEGTFRFRQVADLLPFLLLFGLPLYLSRRDMRPLQDLLDQLLQNEGVPRARRAD